MTIEIRITAPEEWRTAADTMRAALLAGPVSDEDWEKGQPSWESTHSLSAWDGDRCVGHGATFAFDTVVPGGARLATAGVTRIGVLPTHTRRGLLTGIMRGLVEAARDRGDVLASLRASEAVLYERFGFGLAGEAVEIEIDKRRARLRGPGSPPGACRLLTRPEILATVAPLYDRVATRPGVIGRDTPRWKRYLGDALEGAKASHVAVHEGVDGTPDGFVHYDLDWPETFGELPRAVATVNDLWGATPDVELGLWRFVLGLDLIETVRASERPVDDPLEWALVDRRAYRLRARWDEQWLRLVDVDAALRARTYASATAVTVAVTDSLLPANTGTWRIDEQGATRLDDRATAADLSTDVTGVSAAYLGGTSWWLLVASGRVAEQVAGAAARADALFAHRPAPFCGSFF